MSSPEQLQQQITVMPTAPNIGFSPATSCQQIATIPYSALDDHQSRPSMHYQHLQQQQQQQQQQQPVANYQPIRTGSLYITNFRVPAYVPITLSSAANNGLLVSSSQQHPLELAKPILFDCDYQYQAEEDAKLSVRWFRNKEAEPFYQWLPELNERHFADWIKPLVNETFISDPSDPLKRYRSLLIKRLSMNLTAHYTCIVSSLAGQDMRQASLIVYQPPRSFTFDRRVYPAPSTPSHSLPIPIRADHYPGRVFTQLGPVVQNTGFESNHEPARSNQQAVIVRPANNDNQTQKQVGNNTTGIQNTRVVYTHDGRPVRRQQRVRREALNKELFWTTQDLQQEMTLRGRPKNAIQLHHLQCQASQVTPRPVIVLTVKRDADSIAQYLHESSSVSIRPYQVNQADYFQHKSDQTQQQRGTSRAGNWSSTPLKRASNSSLESGLQFTLYDITVSATIALNVSLPALTLEEAASVWPNLYEPLVSPAHLSTVLNFKRGQRMSFECHLEITGTEFETRKRILINEEEVYQFAEVEAHKQRLRNQQFEARRQQHFLDGTTKQEKQENSAQDLKQNQQQLILILFSAIVYKTIFGTNYRFFLMFVRENFVPN